MVAINSKTGMTMTMNTTQYVFRKHYIALSRASEVHNTITTVPVTTEQIMATDTYRMLHCCLSGGNVNDVYDNDR